MVEWKQVDWNNGIIGLTPELGFIVILLVLALKISIHIMVN